MSKKHVYLPNGEEVIIDKELSEGYLVRPVYFVSDTDEHDYGDIEYAPKVFQNPPVQKFSEEILEIQEQIRLKKEELANLKKEKSLVEKEMKDFLAVPNAEQFLLYVNCKYSHIMRYDTLEIRKSTSVYHQKNLVVTIKNGVLEYYILDNSYISDMKKVEVFAAIEAADTRQRELFINRIKNSTNTYDLDSILNKTDWNVRQKLMSEPFIIDVIDNKRKKLAEAVKDIIIRDAQEKLLKAKKTLEESGINPNDLLNDDTQKS
jgi:hypothetical protein